MRSRQLFKPEKKGPSRDLSGDEELPALLDAWETLRARRAADERRIETIKRQIETKLGEAAIGRLPGWEVYWVSKFRRHYEVAAMTVRFIWAERIATRKSPPTRRKKKPAYRRTVPPSPAAAPRANGQAAPRDQFFDDEIPI